MRRLGAVALWCVAAVLYIIAQSGRWKSEEQWGVYCALRPRCARAVHKVRTVPHPDCIVLPSTNNSEPREYRVRSQCGHSADCGLG